MAELIDKKAITESRDILDSLLMIFGIVGVMRNQTKNARSYSQKIVAQSLFWLI